MRGHAWYHAACAALLLIAADSYGARRQGPATEALVPGAPIAEVDVTLFLIGDAGKPALPPDSEPVLVALTAAAAAAPHPVVAFLRSEERRVGKECS